MTRGELAARPEAHAPTGRGRALPPAALAGALVAGASAWALGWALDLDVLTSWRGHPPLSPLYAFWAPVFGPRMLVFLVSAAALVVLSPRACDPAATSRRAFVIQLPICAAALALALFVAREPVDALGSPFALYPGEEFYDDAARIPALVDSEGRAGVLAFLRHHVALMPRLSLHGQHFPPGHAVWLHAVARVIGPGLVPAGVSVLFAAAAAPLLTYFAARELVGDPAARQATLLLVAAPSFLDFACTSMDAVFLAWATLAWWLGVRALTSGVSPARALASGVAFAGAALSSFSALPVGLVVLVLGAVRTWRGTLPPRTAVRQLALVFAAFVAVLIALRVTTGFDWLASLQEGRRSGTALMASILRAAPSSRWAALSFGNVAAFAIGCGSAILSGLIAGVRARAVAPWTSAALLTLAVLGFGGIYFMETERVWLFAVPWLAVAALEAGAFRPAALRVLLAVGLAQALGLELLLFTLW